MLFLNRSAAAAPKAPCSRPEGRSPNRRRARMSLESLEGRELLTEVPGISLSYGTVFIRGLQADHNTANVSYDGNQVRVSLNGQAAEFNANEVYSISYTGGAWGSDSFSNDTYLSSLVYAYGGNNSIQGGKGFNTIFMYGNNNKYDARGGASYVFSYDGPQSQITSYWNVYTYKYDTSNFYFL